MIEIRKAEITELAILMDIFEQGKRIMRKNGNTKQWTGGYPTEEIIKKDIENGNSYLCLDEEQKIVGTFAFIQGDDPTYAHIYDGAWIDDKFFFCVFFCLVFFCFFFLFFFFFY